MDKSTAKSIPEAPTLPFKPVPPPCSEKPKIEGVPAVPVSNSAPAPPLNPSFQPEKPMWAEIPKPPTT